MNTAASEVEAEIRSAYRWILGRDPDPHGLATYSSLMRSGKLNAQGLRDNLLSSAEFRKNRPGQSVEQREAVNELVKQHTGMIVQRGPFAGMRMIDGSMRGDGDIAPKLLGTYEQELHPHLERFAKRPYDALIDVGCAEGYYSVGAARLFPGAPVIAYDSDKGALDILLMTAEQNGCTDQIRTGQFCDPATLRAVLRDHPHSLVIVDCEGYEKTLFSDPETNKWAASSDLIIECHDIWDHKITPTITGALAGTHDITVERASGRDPNVFPFLAGLSDLDRWRSVWERRGCLMHWLICEGRNKQAIDQSVYTINL